MENTTAAAKAQKAIRAKKDLSGVDKNKVAFSRLKRKLLSHVWVMRLLILSGVLLVLYVLLQLGWGALKQSEANYYLSLANSFLTVPMDEIKSQNGSTNILILGKGGEGHEAPDLTDTIIFASISKDPAKITMISLPRDIWIKELETKLNSVYYWGNKKQLQGGLVLAKSSVEEVVGQPIHYVAVMDFSGFEKIVDVLGEIEVDVETAFTDEHYPIAGKENDLCGGDQEYKCRYETLHFAQGKQFMDGDRALKFARSRNAEGDEGTDFARAARQQKVITAIKNRVMERDVLFSYKKLNELKKVLSESIETDVGESEVPVIGRLLFNARDSVDSHVLSEDLLINPPISPLYDNLYVFIPKNESWEEIHFWVSNILGS